MVFEMIVPPFFVFIKPAIEKSTSPRLIFGAEEGGTGSSFTLNTFGFLPMILT